MKAIATILTITILGCGPRDGIPGPGETDAVACSQCVGGGQNICQILADTTQQVRIDGRARFVQAVMVRRVLDAYGNPYVKDTTYFETGYWLQYIATIHPNDYQTCGPYYDICFDVTNVLDGSLRPADSVDVWLSPQGIAANGTWWTPFYYLANRASGTPMLCFHPADVPYWS